MDDQSAGFRMPSQIKQMTVGDLADATDQGYEDGFKEGQKKGYEAGLQQGEAKMQQQLELELTKIRQLIQAMQHPFDGFREALATEVKNLTGDICEAFLRRKITEDHKTLAYLVDQAVQKLLPSNHQIVVHVNAHNSEVVQSALKDHVDADAWRLQVNQKLSDGNVFLESGHSRVSVDLHQLLEDYLRQMSENASTHDGGEVEQ